MKLNRYKMIVKIKIVAILSSIAFASCAAPTPIPEVSVADASVYAARCGGCHSIPHPKRHTVAQWEHILGLMDRRIKERGLPAIEPAQREMIRAYLTRNAR
jgi:hypothetical protein